MSRKPVPTDTIQRIGISEDQRAEHQDIRLSDKKRKTSCVEHALIRWCADILHAGILIY